MAAATAVGAAPAEATWRNSFYDLAMVACCPCVAAGKVTERTQDDFYRGCLCFFPGSFCCLNVAQRYMDGQELARMGQFKEAPMTSFAKAFCCNHCTLLQHMVQEPSGENGAVSAARPAPGWFLSFEDMFVVCACPCIAEGRLAEAVGPLDYYSTCLIYACSGVVANSISHGLGATAFCISATALGAYNGQKWAERGNFEEDPCMSAVKACPPCCSRLYLQQRYLQLLADEEKRGLFAGKLAAEAPMQQTMQPGGAAYGAAAV
eukprot:TRINITY_DN2884_c0_g1_i1.p1 TRINITY_DN2884_c0_g1~~TRINITY_DN2884_c0_g1_i1.p1  ORF type:complete len:263 (+),score=58.03 TRINITY_DN2884_c0_g1_i1:72-860(+)